MALGESAMPYELLTIIIVQLLTVYRRVLVTPSVAACHAAHCRAFRFRDLSCFVIFTHSPMSMAGNIDTISPENEAPISSSPPHKSSHDEYSPDRPPHVTSESSLFTSPSNRSNTTGNLPLDVRTAIQALYTEIYGRASQLCLVTHSKLSLILAHVVQRASTYDQVRLHLSAVCS
jgi:hypothetical protein